MAQNVFPPGWNEERVRSLIAHYENQTEDEAIAEDAAAFENEDFTIMLIPTELVPAVRALLAQHEVAPEHS